MEFPVVNSNSVVWCTPVLDVCCSDPREHPGFFAVFYSCLSSASPRLFSLQKSLSRVFSPASPREPLLPFSSSLCTHGMDLNPGPPELCDLRPVILPVWAPALHLCVLWTNLWPTWPTWVNILCQWQEISKIFLKVCALVGSPFFLSWR